MERRLAANSLQSYVPLYVGTLSIVVSYVNSVYIFMETLFSCLLGNAPWIWFTVIAILDVFIAGSTNPRSMHNFHGYMFNGVIDKNEIKYFWYNIQY